MMKTQTIHIGTQKLYDVDINLYSQFMEPLGATDGSVEAAWNFDKHTWREDFLDITKKLAPPMMRYGGDFSAYYHWREGVGPRNKRIPMHNVEWGGLESNQVGTHELIDLCRQVGASPLININFEGDGVPFLYQSSLQGDRRGYADEAAEWVDYCNNPNNKERIANGAKEPFDVRYWEIGNETSYYGKSTFTPDIAAKKTLKFAKAMHKADPSIQLIAWGDRDKYDTSWAKYMMEEAGEHISYLDFHYLFGKAKMDDSPLVDNRYLEDPDATWDYLMNVYKMTEKKMAQIREDMRPYPHVKAALCESHFSIRGKNRGDVLTTWASGVSNAQILNTQFRNGDILKIGNLSDFCGTRWQVNTIMIPTPIRSPYKAYLLPVGLVTMLYRHHVGQEAVAVKHSADYLDITASKTAHTYYLHIINTNQKLSQPIDFHIDGKTIKKVTIYELATDPMFEIVENTAHDLQVKTITLDNNFIHRIPAASVSAIELEVE